jgi:fructoselysine 3-epimerase
VQFGLGGSRRGNGKRGGTRETALLDVVLSDYADELKDHLHYAHLAERGRMAPGDGDADFPSLVATLNAQGYDGFLAVEAGFNRRDVDSTALGRRAHDYLRRLDGQPARG